MKRKKVELDIGRDCDGGHSMPMSLELIEEPLTNDVFIVIDTSPQFENPVMGDRVAVDAKELKAAIKKLLPD
ncbi:hypothetical protein SPB21_22500 [Leptothoe sp. ISB3NOV94-8A]|nr:hypothetical protein [Adonisia turfae]MDV3352009.1 hypothetical protein [Leptothoe sp. LEGE 181152]